MAQGVSDTGWEAAQVGSPMGLFNRYLVHEVLFALGNQLIGYYAYIWSTAAPVRQHRIRFLWPHMPRGHMIEARGFGFFVDDLSASPPFSFWCSRDTVPLLHFFPSLPSFSPHHPFLGFPPPPQPLVVQILCSMIFPFRFPLIVFCSNRTANSGDL